jgi:cell volume regulation protein A
MPGGEPFTTALFLTTAGVLLAASVLFSGATRRLGLPVGLVFVGIGMLAGSEGLGHLGFDDVAFAWRLGTVALVLILFDGGLNTPLASFRVALWPASALATAGVAGTAGLVGVAARLLGFPWELALLLGAVVSSTDAAAVFSILRTSGVQLKRRVGATLELESGLNDPMAVILTVALTERLTTGTPLGWGTALELVLKLAGGGLAGAAIGYGAGCWGASACPSAGSTRCSPRRSPASPSASPSSSTGAGSSPSTSPPRSSAAGPSRSGGAC